MQYKAKTGLILSAWEKLTILDLLLKNSNGVEHKIASLIQKLQDNLVLMHKPEDCEFAQCAHPLNRPIFEHCEFCDMEEI